MSGRPEPWTEIGRPIVPGMPVFPGDPPVRVRPVATVADDGFGVTELAMCVHAGTHVDAPRHVEEAGAGAEAYRLEDLCGPAWVLDARGADGLVGAAEIARVPPDAERLLVATSSAAHWDAPAFVAELVALDLAAAEEVARRRMRLVGIDYMSIAPVADPGPVHRALLGSGVAVLEGLDLRPLAEGWHEVLVAPLRIVGADGAPARAAARPLPAHSGGGGSGGA